VSFVGVEVESGGSDMPEKYVFLDTSILLHYRSFDEVDWLAVLEAKSIALVFAPIVISELNAKKDGQISKLKQRAASTLKRLESLWERGDRPEVRPGVDLILQDAEPAVDYAAHQLDPQCQDDRLLASVLDFLSSHATTEVVVVANDFGLRLKGRRLGIAVTGLSDTLKLPEEADPNEKRIQQLERELLELKRAMAVLELTFPDGADRLTLRLPRPVVLSRDDIEREMKLVRLRHTKMGEEEPTSGSGAGPLGQFPFRSIASLYAPTKEAIGQYNAELEEYYRRYDTWLSVQASRDNPQWRTLRLEFVLSNTGTAPAEDIDLFLHFPDGLALYTEQDLPRLPPEPTPPKKPEGRFASLSPFLADLSSMSVTMPTPDISPRNVSAPVIRRTDSFEVNIHVKQLKHNLMQPLGALYVVFDNYEGAGSFGIDWDMVAANLPKPPTGTLHVIIEKETG
jgi:hypothetical protein